MKYRRLSVELVVFMVLEVVLILNSIFPVFFLSVHLVSISFQVWLPHLPALLSSLQRPEQRIVKTLLIQLGLNFPQVRRLLRTPCAALSLYLFASRRRNCVCEKSQGQAPSPGLQWVGHRGLVRDFEMGSTPDTPFKYLRRRRCTTSCAPSCCRRARTRCWRSRRTSCGGRRRLRRPRSSALPAAAPAPQSPAPLAQRRWVAKVPFSTLSLKRHFFWTPLQ